MKTFLGVFLCIVMTGCALHPISIMPTPSAPFMSPGLVKKNVAYLISESDKNKPVTVSSSLGSQYTYYPYKDLEVVIRRALSANYANVIAITDRNEIPLLADKNIAYLFMPEIKTTSRVNSYIYWQPTEFDIDINTVVADHSGYLVTSFRVYGTGTSMIDELSSNNGGLAGQRAANSIEQRLTDEIRQNSLLH